MALLCRIDGYDLSGYLQAAVDEFDPAKAFSDPQFAGNSLTDGDLFISITRHNREWALPVLIVADSNDALNATVRTINSHLRQGATLEYREDGASNSTYFDVETAVLESDYRYQRNRQGVGKFLLKVWTRPLGHTGTTRVVATGGATTYAAFPVASMGLVGDANARLRIAATGAASSLMSQLVWGYTPYASYVPRFAGTTGLLNNVAITSAATVPAADAVAAGTTVWGDPLTLSLMVGPTGVLPTYIHDSDVRVFVAARCAAIASSNASQNPSGVAGVLRAQVGVNVASSLAVLSDFYGATGAPVNVYSATAPGASGYAIYDLGRFHVPKPTPDSVGVPRLWLSFRGTNIATKLNASTTFAIEEAFVVPVNGMVTGDRGPFQRDYSYYMDHDAVGSVAAQSYAPSSGSYLGVQPVVRGDLPALSPAAATGNLIVMAMRRMDRNSFAYQRADIAISAREQFNFFR